MNSRGRDDEHNGEPQDAERLGAAGVAVRVRCRLSGSDALRFWLLQLQRLLVTPQTASFVWVKKCELSGFV